MLLEDLLKPFPILESYQLTGWVRNNLEIANFITKFSKDPSSKIGCYITDEYHRPLSLGVNGLPSRLSEEKLDNRETKLKHVIHAEENAIINSNGSLRGAIAYVSMPPCVSCMGKLAQAGIKEVVCNTPTEYYLERWSVRDPIEVAIETGVRLTFVRGVN